MTVWQESLRMNAEQRNAVQRISVHILIFIAPYREQSIISDPKKSFFLRKKS
jgi:hypothetical protein